MNCLHCIVSGRVQGVFFRASTQDKANGLGLSGWVKNRYDGAVELEACGDAEPLRQLQEWLWQGPQHASVSDVACKPVECDDVESSRLFTISYE